VPVELGKDDLKPLLSTVKKHAIELEYQVFGRLPLAYSARCFTARHHDLPKDNCQFKCLEYEQGILVKTQEGHSFAQINGIQTQSAKVSNLLNNWQELQQSGIDILRIVPVSAADTLNLVYQLHSLMTFNQAVVDVDRLANRYEFCNGYWSQVEGMSYLT
jgi:O2-independent ubiquinone biosynthesis protein UbiV